MKQNSKMVGEKTEISIISEFINNDVSVSIPFGDNQRYDFIIDVDNVLYKIQSKTGILKDGSIEFSTSSSSYHRGGNRKSYKGQIDYFAVYCCGTNNIYLISVDDVSESVGTLRVNPTKNNQIKRVKWHLDYKLNKQLNNMRNINARTFRTN